MSQSMPTGAALEQLHELISILRELGNAGPRDQSFKQWRQVTLTLLQRIWPGDQQRAARFRRIPFSPPSSRADARTVRDCYERGVCEATAYLESLVEELEGTGKLGRKLVRPTEVPVRDEAPAAAPGAGPSAQRAEPVARDEAEPAPSRAEEPAPRVEAAPRTEPDRPPATHHERFMPPAAQGPPPAAAPEPAAEAHEAKRSAHKPRLKDMLGFGDEGSPVATPDPVAHVEPAAPAPPRPAPPPPAAPPARNEPRPAQAQIEPRPVEASKPPKRVGPAPQSERRSPERIWLEPRIERRSGNAPEQLEPASHERFEVPEAPARDGSATPARAESPAAHAPAAPATPAPSAPSSFTRHEPPAIEPPDEPLVEPTHEDGSWSAPVIPFPTERAAASARPAPEPPSADGEEDGQTFDVDFDLAAEAGLDVEPPPATLREMLERAGGPRRAGTSRAAREVLAMASVVDQLGVPPARRAIVRAALIDLGHQMEAPPIHWAAIRQAMAFMMDYPQVARRIIPMLLPYLEEAA